RDQVARDRYLFYTACSRATDRVYLVREAATDEGSPREASPFWEEAAALFEAEDVKRSTRRRPLSHLTWPLEQAPTERERLRATAATASDDKGTARDIAAANGWERRLDRALAAFSRPTVLTHPLVLEELRARSTFAVTELERFSDCSSMWFMDRMIDPRPIDAQADPRLKGQIAHQTLFRFYSGLPKELGIDRVDPDRVDVDPVSARGIVQDYKSGKKGHSAAQIESERRLQIPLYMLVLRDLVGIEPLGGLYRPLSGERKARGLLRAEARDEGVPGFVKNDYLEEDAFWGQVERARELALGLVERIREGDVQHDPRGDSCPAWCELWPMCRVKRA